MNPRPGIGLGIAAMQCVAAAAGTQWSSRIGGGGREKEHAAVAERVPTQAKNASGVVGGVSTHCIAQWPLPHLV